MLDEMLGSQLLKLVSSAKEKVVLVAPFIKAETFRRVLDAIPDAGQQIVCVTRWQPEDIMDGVCDLEIFEIVSNRANGKLWKHPNLHAKYFRADQSCLIGSANLTGRALGWRVPTNLELLVELDANRPGLQAWETSLMRDCIPVTTEMRDSVGREADQLASRRPKLPSMDVEREDDPSSQWIPLCPSPERLFKIYTGEVDDAEMVKSTFEFAQRDLRVLGPPNGYSEKLFRKHVADRMQKLEVIQKVVGASSAGLSDVQAVELIIDYVEPAATIDAGDVWKVLKRWMMHFFPEQYRIEVGQEILVKSSPISGNW